MKHTFEITLDESAMAELGIGMDERGIELDDLPPDPWADEYAAMLDRYESGRSELVRSEVAADGGEDPFREGIARMVSPKCDVLSAGSGAPPAGGPGRGRPNRSGP